jgi:hypothetical protein
MASSGSATWVMPRRWNAILYVDAIANATGIDQRAALLNRYKEMLPQQEYGKVLRRLREEGILTGRSLANPMVRMRQIHTAQ